MKNLILYFTLGYPENDTLRVFLNNVSKKINYIEFGFPSKSPVYDGPTIRRTHSVALRNFKKEFYEPLFKEIHNKGIRMYSLSYYADLEDNFHDFTGYLQHNAFSGVILPDLLTDYYRRADGIIEKLHECSLDFIPFFTASTPDKVIRETADKTKSWIYYGLQPSTGINVPYSLSDVSGRIREMLPDREINFGFGVRGREDIKLLVENGADGVAIGSLLVKYLDDNDVQGFINFIEESRGVINGLQSN